jgi:4-hydroxy 2-oxovalerate aldolase
MKILDCTLRDGGYYTNWDFDRKTVDVYIQSMNQLPIDYLEIGYRSNVLSGYLGEYFYLPIYVMERIKAETTKKLVVIFDEKNVSADDAEDLLKACIGIIDMVRIAIDPKQFLRAIGLAKVVKGMGIKLIFWIYYLRYKELLIIFIWSIRMGGFIHKILKKYLIWYARRFQFQLVFMAIIIWKWL